MKILLAIVTCALLISCRSRTKTFDAAAWKAAKGNSHPPTRLDMAPLLASTLHDGMTESEAVSLLGPPDDKGTCSSSENAGIVSQWLYDLSDTSSYAKWSELRKAGKAYFLSLEFDPKKRTLTYWYTWTYPIGPGKLSRNHLD